MLLHLPSPGRHDHGWIFAGSAQTWGLIDGHNLGPCLPAGRTGSTASLAPASLLTHTRAEVTCYECWVSSPNHGQVCSASARAGCPAGKPPHSLLAIIKATIFHPFPSRPFAFAELLPTYTASNSYKRSYATACVASKTMAMAKTLFNYFHLTHAFIVPWHQNNNNKNREMQLLLCQKWELMQILF